MNFESGGALSQLRRFDVYSKVHDDYKIKTFSGGIMSLLSIVFMALLFWGELQGFLAVEVINHVLVDTSLSPMLPIMLNISFPHLRCDQVSADAVDFVGEGQANASLIMAKLDLDVDGRVTDGYSGFGESDCGPCFEAAKKFPDQCCNTCPELQQAYFSAELHFHDIKPTAPQCAKTVGCRMSGTLRVSRIGGNLHVALGKSRIDGHGKLVHKFKMSHIKDGFNTSHIIHQLDFGDEVVGLQSPLSQTAKLVRDGSMMFHYYIKLVPTLYTGRAGTFHTYQYSVTEHHKSTLTPDARLAGLPGVFFIYEFTPFLVQKSERTVPLSHFLTSICAIMGGVFTVAGLVDSMLYTSYRGLQRKSNKAKADL